MRILNVRLLLILIPLLMVTGIGIFALHSWQIRRNAGSLLIQADTAEAQGELATATDLLQRYLAFAPHDRDALARFALLLDRQAHTGKAKVRAFLTLDQACRIAPDRADLRRRVARLALDLGRPADARDHLTNLIAVTPADAELAEWMGQCEEMSGHYEAAVEWFSKSLQIDPTRVDAFVRKAWVMRRRLDRAADADQVMADLLKANPDSAAAFLAQARYCRAIGQFEEATVAARQAHQLQPNDSEAINLIADAHAAQNDFATARTLLREGLKAQPNDTGLLLALARIEALSGHADEALELTHSVARSTNDPAQLWAAADLLLDLHALAEARQIAQQLDEARLPLPARDYLSGRIALADNQWTEARECFERARSGLTDRPDLLRQANLYLAEAYRQLSNPDQRLRALRAALEVDPTSESARLGVAGVLEQTGRMDEALSTYRALASRLPAARLAALRLMVRINTLRPVEHREWAEAEEFWEELPADWQSLPEAQLLRGEMLLTRGLTDEARRLLEQLRQANPKRVDVRLALSALATRQGQSADALRILDEAQRDLGDSVDIRLTRAALLSASANRESRQRLNQLATQVEGFSADDRIRLFDGLLAAAMRLEDDELAYRFSEALQQLRPGDVNLRYLQARMALSGTSESAATERISQLKSLEGEDGPLWRYCEAVRLMKFGEKKASRLAEAGRLLAEAGKMRGHWPALTRLEAELAELQNQPETAIEKYLRSVDQGERSPTVIRRLVKLLQQRHRFREAQDVLAKLQESGALTSDMSRLAAEVALHDRQTLSRAADLARQAVPQNTTDYRDALWLGQILSAAGQRDEAEKALRQAVQLDREAVEAHVALVLFLARTKQTQSARKAADEAEQAIAITADPAARAAIWEAVQEWDKAEALFVEAAKKSASDPRAQRNLAGFYLRTGRFPQAEPVLRELMTQSQDASAAAWARRALAIGLAMNGNWSAQREALALTEPSTASSPESPEDQRTRAVVLAAIPDRRKEAIRALTDSFTRMPATADEKFLLARLYENDNNRAKARNLLRETLSSSTAPRPEQVAHLVKLLLSDQRDDEASRWVERLDKQAPGSWAALEARVRLCAARNQIDATDRLLQERADQLNQNQVNDLLNVAALAEELQRFAVAEALFKRFRSQVKSHAGEFPLALFLGCRGRLDEALRRLESVGPVGGPLATVAAGVARHAQVKPEELRRAERWLTAARIKNPRDVSTALALADLRDRQEKFAEAQQLYQEVLRIEPNNTMAANNLGVLLALQGRGAEATQLLQRALEHSGPAPTLLDSLAMARLAAGDADAARRDLERAVMVSPSAVRYFHLARAHAALKNRSESLAAYRKARELGLAAERLHPLERPTFRDMAAALGG